MMKSPYPRHRVALTFPERGKTVQYFKEECDVNNILAKYEAGGGIWQTTARPQYGDFSQVVDYQTAQNALIQANNAFAELPSDIRAYFQNSPQKFVEFCEDQDNLDELRRLGLAPEAQQIPEEILKNEGTKPAE